MPEVLAQLVDGIRAGVRVSVVAKVSAYDRTTRTCTATPLVAESRIIDGERVEIPAIAIEGVPVGWPSGGGRRFEWDLIPGDLVLLLIRTGSHDEVDGGSTTPGVPASARRMDLSDAIALPLYSAPGDPPTAPSNGQPWLTLGSGEALHVGGATYTLVRSDKLADLWGDLELWLASHTHTGVTTGPGVSGTPSLPAPPGASIALLQSSRIKVDG